MTWSSNTFFASHLAPDHLVLDSGCLIHMSPCGDWFVLGTLKNLSHDHSVHVANGQELMATMTGTLWINLLVNGTTLEGLFPNTLLIPKLSTTLVSIQSLTGNHHCVIFDDDWAEVKTKPAGKLVIKAKIGHSGVYIIQTHNFHQHSTYLMKSKSMDINTLHSQLGHLGFDNIWKLVSKNMIEDFQTLTGEQSFCNACAQGKAHQLPLPSGPRTSIRNY